MTIGDSKAGCPCINTADTLSSLTDRHCQLANGDDGIMLTLGGSCVPFSYGSSQCLQHDLFFEPFCDVLGQGQVEDHITPAYCIRPWCYVDVTACASQSHERVYRSSYFPYESEVDVFYSYDTCNSTSDDWFAVEEDIVGSLPPMGGVSIHASFSTYVVPMVFKRDTNGDILPSPGREYYDNSVPYEGAYPHYVKQIAEISNGDIQNFTFTHRSKASDLVHPTSSATAAIQDIQDGLIDMAIGPYWITGQRLKLASFTIPITNDKTFLVIPKPDTKDLLGDQVLHVLAPFTMPLWGLVIGIIVIVSLLSLWFTDRYESATGQTDTGVGLEQNRTEMRRRKKAYTRLALDSFIQKGQFFCNAGVEQDASSSLPNQILLFGFGFFILITVSAYVANLAAFLTLSTTDDVKTMDGAVAARMTVCAHPALKAELQVTWPDAIFYFHEDGKEFHGMLDDYDAGKCRVMAVGWEDTGYDSDFLKKLCERNLVYTGSLVVEITIAFPIRSELAAGFSYWIHQGKRSHSISIESAKEEFYQDAKEELYQDVGCEVKYSGENAETNEYDKIEIKNMFLPLVFLAFCAGIAIVLQVIHQYLVKNGKQSLAGRPSSFAKFAERDQYKDSSITSLTRHRSSELNPQEPEEDEDVEEGQDELHPAICITRSIMIGSLQPDEDEVKIHKPRV